LGQKEEVAVCFLGDGAVAQGSFHESLNLASLWDLPIIYVIENNQWGMGTHIERAIAVSLLAEDKAPGYEMKGYTLDGMDYFNCYAGFAHIHTEVLETSRPVLVEVVTERFKGHSISDPGVYRTKEELKEKMLRDPILLLENTLVEAKWITPEEIKERDKGCKETVLAAMKYAEESPWPDLDTLETDVFAPEEE
jgi:pyruvate dehydrogenase E1 component alpha subunit